MLISCKTSFRLFIALWVLPGVFLGAPEAAAQPDLAVRAGDENVIDAGLEQTAVEEAPGHEAGSAAEAESAAVAGDPIAQSYLLKCMGCHTIGGGALSGPDLKPVAGWPKDSLREAIVRMEKNVGPMTEEEVDRFTELLLAPDAAKRVEAERERRAMREAASLDPPSAEMGERLFHGSLAFANGGISCAACHQAGGRGGNVASSLEDSFERLGKEPLLSACVSPGFPVMRAMYTPQPIRRQEAVHVVKYLEEVSTDPRDPQFMPMYAMGFIGAGLVLAGIGRGHRDRVTGTRAKLVAKAHDNNTRRSAGS